MNDFSLLDFEKLWEGREKVTMVEREIIRSMVDLNPERKVLEIGAGNGRITSALAGIFRQYYALDATPKFLEQISAPSNSNIIVKIGGDLYNAPFLDNSLDLIVMIRVFNFLQYPENAIREFARILRPGGTAIISFFHTGSVATIIDRIKHGGETPRPLSRHVQRVLSSNFDESFYSVAYFKKMAEDAGFSIGPLKSCGLEDYRPFAPVPAKIFVKVSTLPNILSLIPHTFISIRKFNAHSTPSSEGDQILACPECHVPLSTATFHSGLKTLCPGCGHHFEFRNGIIFT